MKQYKGVIFDLDGVICSTDKYHYEAWKIMTDSLGIVFNEKINNRLRGVSRMESLDIILENYDRPVSQDEKERLAYQKNETYCKLLQNMSPSDLAPSVKQTLDALRAKGTLLAIGSSSKNAKFILQRIGLDGYFDAISDGTNITRSKPHPEVFTMAAEMLHLAASDCLVVEDALAGVEAAINGGFDCAGIQGAAESPRVTWQLKSFSDLV